MKRGKNSNIWLIVIVVFFTPIQIISADTTPWWDNFPRITLFMDVQTSLEHHANMVYDGAHNDPGWGIYFQKWAFEPDLEAEAHAAGLKNTSFYSTFGDSYCFVAELGTWNEVDLTPIHNTHWSWQNYSGGTIRWLGTKNFFDDEDFARPYTRTHSRYGSPPMTYPDGTEATGYDGDSNDPRNSRVYDAGCSKNVLGEISLDYIYNDDVQSSGPYDGLLYIPADDKYSGLLLFHKDSACPAWIDYAYASMLMAADAGMDWMYSDNFSAWSSFNAWPVRRAFGDWSVARFRDYLASHFTPVELLDMGVTDVNNFNIREELRSIALGWGWDGASLTTSLWRYPGWLDKPLWRAYIIFKRQIGTEALTNYYNAVHAAALEAGKTDFFIAGNDIPTISLGWVRGNLDMVSTEWEANWGLSTGPRGFMLPPIGRQSPAYKLAREHALSRFVNVWFYKHGYEEYLHNPGICTVLYYEMLASHALPMINYSEGQFAGEETANIEFFDFVSQVESDFGARIPVEDVGIYYSSSSILSRMTPGGYLNHSAQPHQFGFWGWATALGELHYQYKAVPEWKLDIETLADLRVLVIPEAQVFEPNDVNEVLEPWVQGGGLLIVTGVSGRNLGEDGNFDVNPTGYSLAPLTGVTDIETAPAEQLQTIGEGKVLYIRDNIGMEYYNADTTRPSLLSQFEYAMTTMLAGGEPLVLTAGAGVSSRVGLSVFQDICVGRLFVDVTNFDINLETDEITNTPPLTFSVQLPQWLQGRPLTVSVFSSNSPSAADVNILTPDCVEVTVQPVQYYAGVVIESNDINGYERYVPDCCPTIQTAINVASDGDTIIVSPGIYYESINFGGKNVTVRSNNPDDANIVANTVIDANELGPVVQLVLGEDANCTLTGFTITNGSTTSGSGIYIDGASPIIEKNVIAGNSASSYGGGIYCMGGSATIRYNKISDNYASFGGGVIFENSHAVLQNNLIVDNNAYYDSGVVCIDGQPRIVNNTIARNIAVYEYDSSGLAIASSSLSPIVRNNIIAFNDGAPGVVDFGGFAPKYFNYNDVYGHPHGDYLSLVSSLMNQTGVNGNTSVKPLFVDINDFHLQSQAGRWKPNLNDWVIDVNTSRCIDAGNPGSLLGYEPNDINNLRINMGAYGGTQEASKTPNDWSLLADMTNDGAVDLTDYAAQSQDWLLTEEEQCSDLSRNGSVDIIDLALLVQDWLKETSWH